MKNNNAVLYGIIGFLGGIVLTTSYASNAVNNNNVPMMRMMGMHGQQVAVQEEKKEMHGMGMNASMQDMMMSMKDKREDEFDKAFIEAMIPHHQGAIEMAQEAQKYAQHDELKKMADDIISAQTEEINMMEQWQKEWGY